MRVRGNAHQVYEKYLALARDATSAGDRVTAEGYYQFAEHYFRIMNDSTDPQRANSGDGRVADRRTDGADGQAADHSGPSPNGAAAEDGAVDAKPAGNGSASGETDDAAAESESEDDVAKAKPRRRAPSRPRKAASNGAGSQSDPEAEGHAANDDSEPATT